MDIIIFQVYINATVFIDEIDTTFCRGIDLLLLHFINLFVSSCSCSWISVRIACHISHVNGLANSLIISFHHISGKSSCKFFTIACTLAIIIVIAISETMVSHLFHENELTNSLEIVTHLAASIAIAHELDIACALDLL